MDCLSLPIFCLDSSIILSASEIAESQEVAGLDICVNDFSCFCVDIRDNLLPVSDDYKKALESAIEELASLTDHREAVANMLESLDERLHKLRQGVLGLCSISECDFEAIKEKHPKLFPDFIDPTLGLSDSIREVLKSRGDMMSPTEIRDGVVRISTAVSGHKNPLASIHTTLKRLVDADEVVMGIDEGGKTTYGWVGDDKARRRIAKQFASEDAIEILKSMRKQIASNVSIDPFVGQGSAPPATDLVVANPPYANGIKPEIVEALRASRKAKQASTEKEADPGLNVRRKKR